MPSSSSHFILNKTQQENIDDLLSLDILSAFNKDGDFLSSATTTNTTSTSAIITLFLRYGLLIFTVLTVIFAICSNLLLLIANFSESSSKHHPYRTPANIRANLRIPVFITILVVDDLAMALLNGILIYNALFYDGRWVLGELFCRIKEPLLHGVVGISCSLMMAIAIERWYFIGYNRGAGGGSHHHYNETSATTTTTAAFSTAKLQAIGLTGLLITLHVILAIPAILQAQLVDIKMAVPTLEIGKTVEYSVGVYCVQQWQSALFFLGYRCLNLTVTFLIPLTVTLILHLKIIRHLHHMLRQSSIASEHRQANESRTCFTLILVVVAFAVCWIPNQFLGIFIDLKTSTTTTMNNQDQQDEILPLLHYLPYIACAFKSLTIVQAGINPLLYSNRRSNNNNNNNR